MKRTETRIRTISKWKLKRGEETLLVCKHFSAENLYQ